MWLALGKERALRAVAQPPAMILADTRKENGCFVGLATDWNARALNTAL